MVDKLAFDSSGDSMRLERGYVTQLTIQPCWSIKNPEVRDTTIASPHYASLSSSRKSAYAEDNSYAEGMMNSKQLDINTLMKLLTEKDKTINVLRLVNSEKTQLKQQLESLNRELTQKKTIISNLFALLKDVSNRLSSALKIFEHPKSALGEEERKVLETETILKRSNSSSDFENQNQSLINVAKQQILNRLEFLEFKVRNMGLNKVDLPPKSPVSPTKIPENSKLVRLQQDKILLESLWVKAEEDKYALALSLHKRYAIIRSNFYSKRRETKKGFQNEDEVTTLMQYIERLEKHRQQYAQKLQMAIEDHARIMRSASNTMRDMKAKHAKQLRDKQNEIDSLKSKPLRK